MTLTKKLRTAAAVLSAACLLTGCLDDPPDGFPDLEEETAEAYTDVTLFPSAPKKTSTPPSIDDPVTRRTEAETEQTGTETAETGTVYTELTEQTGQTVTEQETTAETTVSTTHGPYRPAEAEDSGVIPLYAEAKTDALLGASLRVSADAASARLAVIPDGTSVSVTGFFEGETVPQGTNRWLRAEYDGKTGYFSADDAVVICEMRPEELSDTQCLALAKLLYPQAQRLMRSFQREGGYPKLETAGAYDGVYRKLRPDLTMQELYARFYAYFSEADYSSALDAYYKEQNGALWVLTGYSSRSNVMRSALTEMTARRGSRMTFSAQTDYFPDSYAVTGTESEINPFTLCYENGRWKTAEISLLQ